MNHYLATFYTQFAAFQSHKALSQAEIKATRRPVPRSLSSSCGTCVDYQADSPCLDQLASDLESVYEIQGRDYILLLHHE